MRPLQWGSASPFQCTFYVLTCFKLDGFAFNIGDPSQSFISESLDNLIGYAEYRNFKFYISLDVYASGNACYQGNLGACGGVGISCRCIKTELITIFSLELTIGSSKVNYKVLHGTRDQTEIL